MRYPILLALVMLIISCENHLFESDKRQLIAKDEIRKKLLKAHSFDITGFKQDTLENQVDTIFKRPLQYTLDFEYIDSSGKVQKKKGAVLFTPDGRSVLNSTIIEKN